MDAFIFSSPALISDGTIYIAAGYFVSSGNSGLYAIETSSSGLNSDDPWPMFHKDLMHTGNK